jgi:Rad3-related DNA helicase
MTPTDIGLPDIYREFRPAQTEAIEFVLESDKRFIALGLPTGSGKTLLAAALSRLLGGKTTVLTSTLGLQDQYTRALTPCGLVDMRGRANYACWEGGTCEDGGRAGCGDKAGCPFLCQLRGFNGSDLGSTSYAFWLAMRAGVTRPETLICDEAGLASEWLSRSLDFQFTERELRDLRVLKKSVGESRREWAELTPVVQSRALNRYEDAKLAISLLKSPSNLNELKRAENLLDRAKKMDGVDDDWTITKDENDYEGVVWKFECIWPGRHRERLFCGIERVILMSGTIRPRTMRLLGIAQGECDFREWPRQFPLKNGPVIWVPTARVTHRMTEDDERLWLARIDEIISARLDRKGLIHSVSYARARQIIEASKYKGRMLWNDNRDANSPRASAVFETFSKKPPSSGAILVSPSFSTGWDFKGELAEYQIIVKLPQADTRSKIMQARIERDSGYPDYVCAQELVQACGRINREEDDRGETIIIDDCWSYFKTKAESSIPRWFKVRREEKVPPPLAKL